MGISCRWAWGSFCNSLCRTESRLAPPGHEGIEQHGEATGLATDSHRAMGHIGEAVEGHIFAKAGVGGGVRLIADDLLGLPGKEAGE